MPLSHNFLSHQPCPDHNFQESWVVQLDFNRSLRWVMTWKAFVVYFHSLLSFTYKVCSLSCSHSTEIRLSYTSSYSSLAAHSNYSIITSLVSVSLNSPLLEFVLESFALSNHNLPLWLSCITDSTAGRPSLSNLPVTVNYTF